MTPEELKNKILTISTRLSNRKVDFLLLGAKQLEGSMKARIFNDGEDSSGRKIGKYKSKSWIQKRSEEGRQTQRVDLEFTGELRDSIQVVRSRNEVYIAITNAENFEKAKGQEERRKKSIFIPSKEERIETEEYITDLFNAEISRLIKLL